MVSAASMVVHEQLSAKRVADELRIPYTTVSEWAKKYRAGGRAALEGLPGRGSNRGFSSLRRFAVVRIRVMSKGKNASRCLPPRLERALNR